MGSEKINSVKRSYARCCDNEEFFKVFYKNFLGQSDEIAELFKNTDWSQQTQLIKKALYSAIIFAGSYEVPIAKRHMEAIAYTHAREYMDIKPELYPIWLETMIGTIKEYDPYFSPELEKAWRDVLMPAINLMISKYDPGSDEL